MPWFYIYDRRRIQGMLISLDVFMDAMGLPHVLFCLFALGLHLVEHTWILALYSRITLGSAQGTRCRTTEDWTQSDHIQGKPKWGWSPGKMEVSGMINPDGENLSWKKYAHCDEENRALITLKNKKKRALFPLLHYEQQQKKWEKWKVARNILFPWDVHRLAFS